MEWGAVGDFVIAPIQLGVCLLQDGNPNLMVAAVSEGRTLVRILAWDVVVDHDEAPGSRVTEEDPIDSFFVFHVGQHQLLQ